MDQCRNFGKYEILSEDYDTLLKELNWQGFIALGQNLVIFH